MTESQMIMIESHQTKPKSRAALRAAEKRANESWEERLARRKKENERKKCQRANETLEDSLLRKKIQAEKQAARRAQESWEEKLARRRRDAERQAKRRANASVEEKLQMRQKDSERQRNSRALKRFIKLGSLGFWQVNEEASQQMQSHAETIYKSFSGNPDGENCVGENELCSKTWNGNSGSSEDKAIETLHSDLLEHLKLRRIEVQ